jgi:preprotein translocase subunit YajC
MLALKYEGLIMINALLNLISSPAYAQTAAQAAPQGGGASLIIMGIIFISVMYFAVWRPQNKRFKEQQTLLNSLAKDDEIITAGGLMGRINKIHKQYIALLIAENVEVVIQKTSVASLLPKGTLKSIE